MAKSPCPYPAAPDNACVHDALAISLGLTPDELAVVQRAMADGDIPYDEAYKAHWFAQARSPEFTSAHPEGTALRLTGHDDIVDYDLWFAFIYHRARQIADANTRRDSDASQSPAP